MGFRLVDKGMILGVGEARRHSLIAKIYVRRITTAFQMFMNNGNPIALRRSVGVAWLVKFLKGISRL